MNLYTNKTIKCLKDQQFFNFRDLRDTLHTCQLNNKVNKTSLPGLTKF